MNEQLHEAAERARSERRQRLVREIAPYLEPGEHVLDATTGRSEGPQESATIRVVATDRRLLVLRKKAFRQFSVQSFSYASAHVSIGFTAEAGGELMVADTAGEVLVVSIPELDLEPLFASLVDRIEEERLEVALDQGEAQPWRFAVSGEFPVVLTDEEVGSPVGAGVRLVEPMRVGAQTIEEILVAAGFPPEPGVVAGVGQDPGRAQNEDPGGSSGEPFRITERLPDAGEAGPSPAPAPSSDAPGEERQLDVPVIIPDEEEISPARMMGAAEAGILRWVISQSGADAGIYLRRDASGDEHLQVEPRRLDAQKAISLVRRAGSALEESPAEASAAALEGSPLLVTRWGEAGDERVIVLSGVRPGSMSELTSFARFVLDRLRLSVGAEGRGEPGATAQRPRLEDVSVATGEDGLPTAVARLVWRDGEYAGTGHGHSSLLGQHLAAARAVADALGDAMGRDVMVEHLFLTYPPMDAELVVVTVLIGADRYVGATTVPPGEETRAAAQAVLDALNRNLPRIAEGPG
ncbi:MAG TPA: hypothetical protein VEM41_09335 [Actinomycetota bacterium]|nr:hypothetical protein [Actinomycetota bacterium]